MSQCGTTVSIVACPVRINEALFDGGLKILLLLLVSIRSVVLSVVAEVAGFIVQGTDLVSVAKA